MSRPKIVPENELTPTALNPFPEAKKVETDNYHNIEIIPSRYVLYPKGTMLKGRGLKNIEVKKLCTLNEKNYNRIINEVISSAIVGLPVDELLEQDKIYLIFWLRANTYKNSNFISEYTCEHCGKEAHYHFDVDKFDVKYIEETYDPSFELKLLNSDYSFTFKFAKIGDTERIEQFKASLEHGLKKYDDETIAIASLVNTVNSEQKTLSKLCEIIDKLEPEDSAYLKSYVEEIDFGVSPLVKAECNHCQEVTEVPVSFRADFFVPKYKFR